MFSMIVRAFLVAAFLAAATPTQLSAQAATPPIEPMGPARLPNADPAYQALRTSMPMGDGVSVKGFTLEREGGIFHFDAGSFYFYAAVNARITGAVFVGQGHFQLAPKEASEQHSLALLTKSGVMAQDFSTVVLRFTDRTFEEIQKASSGGAPVLSSQAINAAVDLAKGFRSKLHENLELRLLGDVLGPPLENRVGFFLASFRMGGVFTGRNVLFVVDPQGTPHAAPDQVELATWSEDEVQTWAAYSLDHAHAEGLPVRVASETLDVVLERSGAMRSTAETTVTVRKDGLRVLRLNLYPTLRVTGAYSEAGLPLDFVQEGKNADPDFAIVLPIAAKAGDTVRVLTRYAGPDAVRKDGDGVYTLMSGARESWYPAGSGGLGDFVNFRMTFHIPRNLDIVATGKQISHESEPGGGQREVWATDSPIPVAGFNLGEFKSGEAKTPAGFEITAYANVNLPDYVSNFANRGMGTLSTVPALKNELAQGNAAIQVYTDFFGKLPYDHIALTQQSACNYGQSWPMLVYLPTCAFWDMTVQQAFGLLEVDRSYWQEVTPHEVSHQWWGQLVGFNSYRDQWMSEGFANFSVGIFLLQTRPKMDDYRDFWTEQRENLLRKNKNGKRPVDVGPLTMGYRVNNEKTGDWVAQMLIYSKGAYVMHMLEMMYWTPKLGEAPFKKSMQQFVTDYSGKAATTEDLKASFEHTMPKWLDLAGNGKLDWFFDEYIYGTELPHYTVESDFSTSEGETTAHFKVTQSGVSKSFVMLVPLYLQMENGNTVRLTNLTMRGEAVVDHSVKLGKLPSPAKKMLLNYNADVLSD